MASKNEVTLTFGGDATALERASQRATQATGKTEKGFGKLASGAAFLTAGLSNLGDSIHAVADVTRIGQQRADRLARAQSDVAQATLDLDQANRDARQSQLDLAQAQRDSAQAGLDVEQAQLDAEGALRDYNDAVSEFGAGSLEARQAQLDLKQANEDLAQAQLDSQQAAEDESQALQDGQQAAQDAKDAQLDLKDAQREASDVGGWRGWLDTVTGFAPLLMTAVGAMQLMRGASIAQTIAQWAQNAAWLAFPITWIVAGIIALIAIIVLLITHWDDVKEAAGKAWDWIKDKAVGVWDWMKTLPDKIKNAFLGLGNILLAPFKNGFNAISDAWNNTVGKLSWSVPSWVPFVGGKTISAPKLPHFHTGGTVPGAPGQEVLAVLQAGEKVTPAGKASDRMVLEIRSGGTDLDNVLVQVLRRAILAAGGDVQVVLGR